MRNSLLLILKNATRNKRRSFLAAASMAASLCALGLIFALYQVLFIGGDETPATALRLRVSLTEELPASFEEEIRRIPGVKAVTSLRWFGETYKDPGDARNHFAQFAIEPQAFLMVHPEIHLSAQEQQAFLTRSDSLRNYADGLMFCGRHPFGSMSRSAAPSTRDCNSSEILG